MSQILTSQRKFALSNALNFSVFTLGIFMMIQILEGASSGVTETNKDNNTTAEGSAQEPTQDTAVIVLALLSFIYGMVSTGIANNIWPKKHQVKHNGHISPTLYSNRKKMNSGEFDFRKTLDNQDDILKEIGAARKMVSKIKEFKSEHVSKSKCSQFSYKLWGALPTCLCLPRKFRVSSEQLLHMNNLSHYFLGDHYNNFIDGHLNDQLVSRKLLDFLRDLDVKPPVIFYVFSWW